MNPLGVKNDRKKGDRDSSLGRQEIVLVELTLLLPSHMLLLFSEAGLGGENLGSWHSWTTFLVTQQEKDLDLQPI